VFIDNTVDRAYVGPTGAGRVKLAYTTAGYGVSVVTLDGGPITPLALTPSNGQDLVLGMAMSSTAKMRVLFQRTGGLYYFGEN
jgi:hypothetical protein